MERVEIGTWLTEVAAVSLTDPDIKRYIEDVDHAPISQVPTTVARNRLVDIAQKQGADILFMVDDDSAPPEGFFKAAFQFLRTHNGPAAIAVPYCCGGKHETVQVFEWQSPNNDPQRPFALKQIGREDAARRKGIERVANIGTHVIAYKMDCFDAIKKPYYDYTISEDGCKIEDTEDVFAHRAMYLAGVKLYAHWDYWTPHYKVKRIEKPWIVEKEDIDQRYLAEAKAELRGKHG